MWLKGKRVTVKLVQRRGGLEGWGLSRVVSSHRWCRSDTSLFKGIVVVWLQAAAGGTLAMRRDGEGSHVLLALFE